LLLDSTRKKQHWVVFAILLFLVFDFSILALNYWLSQKIEKDAVAINLAGRQRMLTQSMFNALLNLQLATQSGNNAKPYLAELSIASKLFNDTLKSFHHKHLAYSGENQPLYLEPLSEKSELNLLNEADKLWQPYNKHIQALQSNYQPELLNATTSYASENSPRLLDLMNQLTSHLQDKTRSQTRQIRTYQGIAFLLALANFLGILFMYTQRIREVNRSSLMLHNIINRVAVSVLIVDANNKVIDSNHTAQLLFQYEKNEMIGKNLDLFLQDLNDKPIAKRKDGSPFMAEVEHDNVKLDNQHVTILTITDVTQQHMTVVRLNEIAQTDTLTGLPNRVLFDDRLNLEIQRVQLDNSLLAVMFIDLDNFKAVNDTYGHYVGDQLLKELAQRMRLCLRETDTISRRGGDEFTIAISISSIADGERIAHNILQQISAPLTVGGLSIEPSASIGISLYPTHSTYPDQLIAYADAAMYQAKLAGGNQIKLFVENRQLPI
jgi:diguanylate cyclase (GGDEF)-like protein